MVNQTYRPIFHPAGPFVCNKPFVMSGVSYVLGDRVDVTGVEVRRLRQMYEARMIEVAPAGPAAAVAVTTPGRLGAGSPATKIDVQPAREIAPPEGRADPGAAAAPADGEKRPKAKFPGSAGMSVEYRGFGRYFVVDAGGQPLAGPLSKSEAFTKAGVPATAAAAE